MLVLALDGLWTGCGFRTLRRVNSSFLSTQHDLLSARHLQTKKGVKHRIHECFYNNSLKCP